MKKHLKFWRNYFSQLSANAKKKIKKKKNQISYFIGQGRILRKRMYASVDRRVAQRIEAKTIPERIPPNLSLPSTPSQIGEGKKINFVGYLIKIIFINKENLLLILSFEGFSRKINFFSG